jgi:hypothetical protein
VQDARVAERERQRRCRAARRERQAEKSAEGGRVTGSCHALASDAKYAELHDKVRESVDRAVALSRAALYRLVPRILADFARSEAAVRTEAGP